MLRVVHVGICHKECRLTGKLRARLVARKYAVDSRLLDSRILDFLRFRHHRMYL